MSLGVLASGSGTILEAILEAGLPVAVVLVDRRCRAEEVASAHGLAIVVLERRDFSASFDRERYSVSVIEALAPFHLELIAMAGFGTILGRAMHDAYPGRILNTHPSLLPAFKGWHAVQAALRAGVDETGCTVHVATLEVDEGTILAQARVAVLVGDTEAVLHERIKDAERRLYPATIRAVLDDLANGAFPASSPS